MLTWMIGSWNHHESRWLSDWGVGRVAGSSFSFTILEERSIPRSLEILRTWHGVDALWKYAMHIVHILMWISMESIAVLIEILSCRIIPNITNIYQYYRVISRFRCRTWISSLLWSPRLSQFSSKLRVSCPPSNWSPLLVWLCQSSFSVLRNCSVFCICPFLYVTSFFVQIYVARGRFRLIQIIGTCWEAINKGGEYSGPTLSGDSLKGKPCLKAGCRNHTFHSWLNHVESYRGSRSPIDTGAWAYTSLAHTPWGSADGAGARERERERQYVCVCLFVLACVDCFHL